MDSRKVIDASAMGALLFGEPESRRVARELQGGTWFAPILLDYEIASIYLKKLKHYPSLREKLRQAYLTFREFPVERVHIPVENVVSLAQEMHLTIYDASYLWLARELGADLVTLDQKLQEIS